MKHCDITTIPLSKGNLIEASAGTGKTYTICGLVLRLLLEKELAIENILVVTYTDAATEELRGRVRAIIRDGCEVLMHPAEDDRLDGILAGNDLLASLSRKYASQNERARARDLLVSAVRNFDLAAIFTIHGFCRRMLQTFCLESNVTLSAELLTDENELLGGLVKDFWRKRIYPQDGLFLEHLDAAKITPESLLSFARQFSSRPIADILPRTDSIPPGSFRDAELRMLSAHNTVRASWKQFRQEVTKLLLEHPGLNRTRYGKRHIPGWFAAMDEMVASPPSPALFSQFAKFTARAIEGSTKNGHQGPEHQFFIQCQELLEAAGEVKALFDHSLIDLKRELLDEIATEMSRIKESRGIFSFNDLLTGLRDGLTGADGRKLAQAISARFPAALIDEFQDTDPVQSEIFSAIYREQGVLFLIGDPKQAIYSFRGADIFAYLDAAATLSSDATRYTLDTNYRSGIHLVTAVNTLFSRARAPFFHKKITFKPVRASQQGKDISLAIDNTSQPPFIIWFFKRPPGETRLQTKTLARQRILNSLAGEIVRILLLGSQGRARIKDEPLTPADIAVLVRTNSEARQVQRILSHFRVPSVLHSSESLFSSNEARDVELLLEAIIDPGDEKKIPTALATELFGMDGTDIFHLVESREETESGFGGWQDYFFKALARWKKDGFLAMYHTLFADHDLRARILCFPDGERRLTNYLHLAEVLARIEYEENASPAELFQALINRMQQENEDQEHQLRLESDARCVRIVTIHKAKGLEYPVVFCPFSWEGGKTSRETALFHESGGHTRSRLILDLGSPEISTNQASAAEEELAENLRLLYVALTRGKARCYFAWGAFTSAESSAPAYLLHQSPATDPPDPIETAARFREANDDELLADLKSLAADAPEAIVIRDPPAAPREGYQVKQTNPDHLSCPVFTSTIDRSWRLTSFSALTGDSHRAPLMRAPEPRPAVSGKNLFSFPAGSRAGIFFHALLEKLDFSQPPPEGFIQSILEDHSLDSSWERILATLCANLCATPLPVMPGSSRPQETFRLKSITRENRLNELEFTFRLDPLTTGKLTAAFSRRPDIASSLARLNFPPSRGYIKGFIDLVFHYGGRYYLVDWKSNFLGADFHPYHRDLLAAVMNKEFYTLQYHLYTVALHRFLAARLPGYSYTDHFGGVFYIFLRGINRDLGSDYGIFQDKPEEELILALSDTLSSEDSAP